MNQEMILATEDITVAGETIAESDTEEITIAESDTEEITIAESDTEEITIAEDDTEEITIAGDDTEESTGEDVTISETGVQSSQDITSMSMPFIGVSVVQCVVAIMLIVVILQQSKTASGMTASGALTGSTPKTYWDQNKGRSKEYKLSRMTVILGAIFLVLCFVLSVIK